MVAENTSKNSRTDYAELRTPSRLREAIEQISLDRTKTAFEQQVSQRFLLLNTTLDVLSGDRLGNRALDIMEDTSSDIPGRFTNLVRLLYQSGNLNVLTDEIKAICAQEKLDRSEILDLAVIGGGPMGVATATAFLRNSTDTNYTPRVGYLDNRSQAGGQFGNDELEYQLQFSSYDNKTHNGVPLYPPVWTPNKQNVIAGNPIIQVTDIWEPVFLGSHPTSTQFAKAVMINSFLTAPAQFNFEVEQVIIPTDKTKPYRILGRNTFTGEPMERTAHKVVFATGLGKPTYGDLNETDERITQLISSGKLQHHETFRRSLAELNVAQITTLLESGMAFVGGSQSAATILTTLSNMLGPTELQRILQRSNLTIYSSYRFTSIEHLSKTLTNLNIRQFVKIIKGRIVNVEEETNGRVRVVTWTGKILETHGQIIFATGYQIAPPLVISEETNQHAAAVPANSRIHHDLSLVHVIPGEQIYYTRPPVGHGRINGMGGDITADSKVGANLGKYLAA